MVTAPQVASSRSALSAQMVRADSLTLPMDADQGDGLPGDSELVDESFDQVALTPDRPHTQRDINAAVEVG